jgi:pimeloyl-ACP methyl ester carboxylesterase
MKTLFLPGYSVTNKLWMEETITNLPELSFVPAYWEHWSSFTEQPFQYDLEIRKVISTLPNEPVNILSKSIGTVIALKLLATKKVNLSKLVLCGIPLHTVPEATFDLFRPLSALNANDILVIQNDKDPVAPSSEVVELISSINPDIKIINKPDSTHTYRYSDDFAKFLS